MKLNVLRVTTKMISNGSDRVCQYSALVHPGKEGDIISPSWIEVSPEIYDKLINCRTYGNILQVEVVKE